MDAVRQCVAHRAGWVILLVRAFTTSHMKRQYLLSIFVVYLFVPLILLLSISFVPALALAQACPDGQTWSIVNSWTGSCVALNAPPTSPPNSGTPSGNPTPAQFCTNGICTYTPLEPLPGQPPASGSLSFAHYVNNIFTLSIVIGAMLAVAALVFSGITYMISEAIPQKDWAKRKLRQALWALLILLGSYLILSTVNPNLVVFNFDSGIGTTTGGGSITNPLEPCLFISQSGATPQTGCVNRGDRRCSQRRNSNNKRYAPVVTGTPTSIPPPAPLYSLKREGLPRQDPFPRASVDDLTCSSLICYSKRATAGGSTMLGRLYILAVPYIFLQIFGPQPANAEQADCAQFFQGRPFIEFVGKLRQQERVTFFADGTQTIEHLSSGGAKMQNRWHTTPDGFCYIKNDGSNGVCYIVKKVSANECAQFYQAVQLSTWTFAATTEPAQAQQGALSVDANPVATAPIPVQPPSQDRSTLDCAKATSAPARLICSDTELSKLVDELNRTFGAMKKQMPKEDQPRASRDELAWIRDRNNRCNLIGNNSAPIDQLANSKGCMVAAI